MKTLVTPISVISNSKCPIHCKAWLKLVQQCIVKVVVADMVKHHKLPPLASRK